MTLFIQQKCLYYPLKSNCSAQLEAIKTETLANRTNKSKYVKKSKENFHKGTSDQINYSFGSYGNRVAMTPPNMTLMTSLEGSLMHNIDAIETNVSQKLKELAKL